MSEENEGPAAADSSSDFIQRMVAVAVNTAISWAVGRGYVLPQDAPTILSALTVLLVWAAHAGFSQYRNRISMVVGRTQSMKGVQVVTTRADLASVPGIKRASPESATVTVVTPS